MYTKVAFVIGVGVGYVLGARAGRERYETIRSVASKVRQMPVVAGPLDTVGDRVSTMVRRQGERVTDKVAEAVKERLFGMTPDRSVDNEAATGPHSTH